MNIRCPSCKTVFRVDPARIPAGGVRARCSRCSNTFEIRADMAAAGVDGTASETAPPGAAARAQPAEPARAAGPAPAAATAAAAKAPDAPLGQEQPTAAPGAAAAGRQAAPAPRTAPPTQTPQAAPHASPAPQPPRPQAGVAPAGAPAPAPGSDAATGTAPRPPLFGARDPAARAQRIARALVSDIVAYHPKRREECLANGTLRTEFREEIMKSWEEYVAQVGLEVAKSTPHFRNALNEILAKGQRIF